MQWSNEQVGAALECGSRMGCSLVDCTSTNPGCSTATVQMLYGECGLAYKQILLPFTVADCDTRLSLVDSDLSNISLLLHGQ
jgi:hypothetical protein